MSEREPVRIGFVGVGTMGQCAHLRHYATLPDCVVCAISELRPELGRRVAERWSVPAVYRTAEEMIANERLDGLVASQPFDRHSHVIPPLYASGLPVFTEKPLASTLAAARGLLAALSESSSWHMVGYHKRSDPATARAKHEIEALKASGELGRMRYVRLTMPPGDWVANGFTDLISTGEPYAAVPGDSPPADLSPDQQRRYVEFVNYYIHQVNLLRWLFGEPYTVTHADPTGALLVAQSAGGVCGTIEMAPYATSVDWDESALVGFEHGYVRLELPAPLALNRPGRVRILRDPGEAEPEVLEPVLPWIGAMRQQAMNFVAAIRGEAEPPCGAAEALEDLICARQWLDLMPEPA